MNLTLNFVYLYIYFLQVILVTANTKWIGRYKVSKRSQKIKHCASKHISKKEANGVLVSESTGHCKDMSGKWDEEQIDPGYEYAKLAYNEEIFDPPITLGGMANAIGSELVTHFPVTFTSGTSYNVYITWPNMAWNSINFSLYGNGQNNNVALSTNLFSMSVYGNPKEISIRHTVNNVQKILPRIYYDDRLGSECKISFVANGNTTEILFNDKVMATLRSNPGSFGHFGLLVIHYGLWVDKPFFVRGTGFNLG